jgi:hypothetical protein
VRVSLLETNETLFYHTLMSDPARFLGRGDVEGASSRSEGDLLRGTGDPVSLDQIVQAFSIMWCMTLKYGKMRAGSSRSESFLRIVYIGDFPSRRFHLSFQKLQLALLDR